MNAPGQADPDRGAGVGPGTVGPVTGREVADPPTTALFLGAGSGAALSRPATPEDAEQDQEWLEAISRLPATSALLRVGAAGGGRFLLNTDRTTVGRRIESDIFLDHATVSRSHAVFERRGTEFRVQDLGSLNGTYVNGVVVETAVLRTGDRIQIGKFTLVFHQSPAALPQRRPVPGGGPAAGQERAEDPGSTPQWGPVTAPSRSGTGGWAALVRRVRSWFSAGGGPSGA